jgi:hypothetical protein
MTPESQLLSERQVAERSGLAGPLVDALIPRLPAAADGPYHAEAKVYKIFCSGSTADPCADSM